MPNVAGQCPYGECSKGKYLVLPMSAGSGGIACKICEAGKFIDKDCHKLTSCDECPTGTYNEDDESKAITDCIDCTRGT